MIREKLIVNRKKGNRGETDIVDRWDGKINELLEEDNGLSLNGSKTIERKLVNNQEKSNEFVQ
jgi:hypothetical protein